MVLRQVSTPLPFTHTPEQSVLGQLPLNHDLVSFFFLIIQNHVSLLPSHKQTLEQKVGGGENGYILDLISISNHFLTFFCFHFGSLGKG